MTLLPLVVCVLSLTAALFCAVRALVFVNRAERREEWLMRYTSLFAQYIDTPPAPSSRPIADRATSRHERMIVGELLCSIYDNIKEYDSQYFNRLIGERCRRSFIRQTYLSTGFRRARYMHILSVLPPETGDGITFRHFKNTYCDYFKLLIAIYLSPQWAMTIVDHHEYILSPKAINRLSQHLSSQEVRADWRRCLESDNPNLKMIGLAIVSRYQINEAYEQVYQAIVNDNERVKDTAMQTLVGLRIPLSDSRVDRYVSTLDSRGRRRFYRFLVREGYSQAVMRRFKMYESRRNSGLDSYISAIMSNRIIALKS